MKRRDFISTLAALIAAPQAPAAQPHKLGLSLAGLVERRIPIVKGYAILLGDEYRDIMPYNQVNWKKNVTVHDLGVCIANTALTNMRVKDGWLFADDTRFEFLVSDDTILAIGVALEFASGDIQVVGIVDHWSGLPCTVGGGCTITIQWPQSGILGLS